jgi:hypothetical protein
METPLCKLGFLYRTDKVPQLRHSYTPVYYELLKDKRDSIKKVLEIGIGTIWSMKHVEDYTVGASHKMWRDFFPNAMIYGIDIDPKVIFQEERIHTYLMDSTKEQNIKKLINEIGSDQDLVIDDGPHGTRTQLNLARCLIPLLTGDFIYIVEDSRNPDAIKENLEFLFPDKYEVEVKKLPAQGMKDDNLVIVRPR